MSENNESNGFGSTAFGEAAEAYVKFWSDFTSKMTSAAFAASPRSTPPEAMREVRSAMLKAMADASDQYMRSPQFQEAMRQWFSNSVQFRSQINDWASRVRHELQGVSRQDVDALVQVIGRLETRMTDALERISERLDALERPAATAARPTRSAKARQSRRPPSRKVTS